MFKLKENREKGKDQRSAVVNALNELMDHDKSILAMEADLGTASSFLLINRRHPDQFVECGISEANMIGMAAGLSIEGFKPFVHSFAPFAVRRTFDQIYLSGGFAQTTINIFGSDPGFCAGPNGGTHTTFEDVALMKMVPDSIIVDACDPVQLDWTIREFAKLNGIHYVRSNRKPVKQIYEAGSTFELGKANIVKQGTDVLIITAGQLLSEALDAAEQLEKEGISTEVIDMFTIKPLDEQTTIQEAKNKKAVITFENHNILNGLGSSVAETLMEAGISVPFRRLGIKERFGQAGTQDWLQHEYGLTADQIIKTAHELLRR